MTVTATKDGETTALVCPTCGSQISPDPELGLFFVTCDAAPTEHMWRLDTLLERQPNRTEKAT